MRHYIGKSYIDFSKDDLNDSELCINMLYVSPDERGRKLGYQLLNFAVKYARENGYETVGLCAYPQEEEQISDEALVEYYREYGFESDGDCDEIMTYKL